MPAPLIVILALHLLAGVFWAGTTLTLARIGGEQTNRLFAPQMGAALIAVATGGALWSFMHRNLFGITEQILALGVFCAIVAALVQGVGGGLALRKIARAAGADLLPLRRRVAVTQRVAAGLLMTTVICMGVARYV